MPNPTASVWMDFMALRAAAGAVVGAAAYAAGRLPSGWLRTCLYLSLFFLFVEGEINDFVIRPLHDYLAIGIGFSLASGVLVGTV